MFPGDKARADDFMLSTLPQAFGSLASFMAVGSAFKAMGMGTKLPTALLGAFAGAGGSKQDAETFNATDTQRNLATLVGAASGILEYLPIDEFFSALERSGGRSFARTMLDALRQGGLEAGQEGLQTAPTDIFARLTYDPERDVLGNVLESMAAGGITGATLGTLGSLSSPDVEENQKRLLSLRDFVAQSKTNKVAPEVVREHLRKAAEAGNVPPTVTASLEAVETLLQELTPEDMEKAFPGIAEAIEEARAGGVEVSIPVENLAALSQLPGYEAFTEDVRIQADPSVDAFTPKEKKQAEKDIEKFLEEADTEQRNPEDSPVYKNVYDQLIAAGNAPEVARPQARLYHAFFETQAERSGKDPNELMRRYGFEVVSQESTKVPDGAMEQDGEPTEPPVPEGMVRVYHSGSQGEGETGRWVSTNRTYASDYRRDLPLFYTDIPANDPRVTPDEFNPDQGVKQGFTFNFELTPEEAAGLTEVPREGDTNLQQPADITRTPQFKAWFGNSKVVDEAGAPLVVYHGTDKTFSEFKKSRVGGKGVSRAGFFFASDPAQATTYAYWNTSFPDEKGDFSPSSTMDKIAQKLGVKEIAPQVMPVMLSIKNPYNTASRDLDGRTPAELKKEGYDGALIREEDGGEMWVAFDPTQIKSATGNRGTFDPASPNILMQAMPDPLTRPGGDWRNAEIEAIVDGEPAMVPAGEAVDFIIRRRAALKQLMECLDAN
jgi:hypothetical protein